MATSTLIRSSRRASGLSQEELARRSHTSRTTLSAYENGRKSPSLETAQRILSRTGHDLIARPRLSFAKHRTRRGRVVAVPDGLPQLPPEKALATVVLPVRLNWSDPDRTFDLRDRVDRARVYEIVLREGEPKDFMAFVDGTLLVDLWQDLVLPREVRELWTPLVSSATGRAVA